MKNTWIVIVVIAAIFGVGYAFHGGKGRKTTDVELYGGATRNLPDGEFHVSAAGQPKSCDPTLVTTIIENHVAANVCEGLVTWTQNGPSDGPQPGMADSWKVSDDGKVYTFHVRDNAKWSSGTQLTAYDFAWSWGRVRTKETGCLYAFLLDEALVANFEALDVHQFRVTLSKPNGIFMSVLTLPALCAEHEGTIKQNGTAWCQPSTFVGNGPYVIAESVLSDHITLKKNKYYWDQKNVELETIVIHTAADGQLNLNLYKQGKLDWLGAQTLITAEDLDKIRIKGDSDHFTAADVSKYTRMAVTYITVNHKRPGLNNKLVRRALSLAIDRAAIEENVTRTGDIPTVGFFPPGMGAYKPVGGDTKQNCVEGRRLMAEAGYSGDKKFPVYEFLYRSGGSDNVDMAPAIADQWKQCLGIEVKLVGLKMELWQPKVVVQHDYDITMDGWQGDYPHPQTFAGLQTSHNSMNYSGYGDSTYDAAVDAAVVANTDAALQKGYEAVESIIGRDTPIIPLYFQPRIHALRPEWEGIVGNVALSHPLKYVRRKATPVADK